jgi:hypothetical protein
MAEQEENQAGDLQFDQAEYEEGEGQLSCAACENEIYSTYFDINGRPTCERCRYQVEEELSSGAAGGRFIRALLAGSAAGAVGSALYFGIAKLTGWEIGLVAIVVGLMVGFAVKWGCNGRGGWFYQGLAMLLTYLAIVTTYIPGIVAGIREEFANQGQSQTPPQGAGDEAPADADTIESFPGLSEDDAENTTGRRLIGYTLILVIAMLAPFLMVFESPIGLLIIGIGLYEAWKINKKLVLEITGPFQVGQARPLPATNGAADR